MHKREPEDIVGNRGKKAARESNDNIAPKLSVSARPIEQSVRKQDCHGGEKDREDEQAHRTNVIKIRQQAGDGRESQEKYHEPSSRRPKFSLFANCGAVGHANLLG
jgi:hypothetical protein